MRKKKPAKKKDLTPPKAKKGGKPLDSSGSTDVGMSNCGPPLWTIDPAFPISEAMSSEDANRKRLEDLVERADEIKQLMSEIDDPSIAASQTTLPPPPIFGGDNESQLFDDGLYGRRAYLYSSPRLLFHSEWGPPPPESKIVVRTDLVRTTDPDETVVASMQDGTCLMIPPSFEHVLDEALKVLKDSSLPGSSRLAAKELLSNLVRLLPRFARNEAVLIDVQLLFFSGMLWEQLQQLPAQEPAVQFKNVKGGQTNSAKKRDKRSERIAAYREEKRRCEEAGETFIINDACTKIATAEVDADEKLKNLPDKKYKTRIKSRTKLICTQLRKKYPSEIKRL